MHRQEQGTQSKNRDLYQSMGFQSGRAFTGNTEKVQAFQMQFKESIHDNLMNKRNSIRKNQEHINQNKQQQTCYPKFLTCLGSFCTPFRIVCPCFCFCCMNQPRFQQETQKVGLIQRFGQYVGSLKPGIHLINPISQKVIEVNIQTQILNFSQVAFTKDNVQFDIQSIVFFRVVDPQKLVYHLGISQYQANSCVSEIAQGTLRGLIGQSELQDVIEKRQLVGKKLANQMNRMLQIWGIYIESASIKNLRLNQDLQNIMSSVAKTKRFMEAMLINYGADIQVAKLLKEMSLILETKAAFQIRYLDLLTDIINNRNEKLIIIKTINSNDLNTNQLKKQEVQSQKRSLL